jgi:hypothetical protein
MKRFQEKIKDLIEARDYEAVKNYAADLEQTISSYRFTDATSDLLAKWLDETARLAHGGSAEQQQQHGAAVALAGNRGAGKSHLLAVLAGLIEQPDLRSLLTDAHVASYAQSLPRRQLKVLRVMRGAGATLGEEMDIALTLAFNEPGSNFGSNPALMLANAAARVDVHPLIVVIDSAPTRLSRVKRDDGEQLGAMAEVARRSNVFLAAALDDDISGADGVNAAIVRTFQIDFLDQEHLYRILDAHIFPKKATARPLLRELYHGLRAVMPGFNWSEPRFNALYPIHPVVADVTPAVRLFAQNFAFLPFAAESGKKTLNRPAHSLIALDEIFDRAEPDLRKSADLTESFAVYDDLATSAIGQIPVMQRLQAKLALKGLFILSLDGRGATAREVAAAMLTYDENEPDSAVFKTEEMLQTLAAAASEKLQVRGEGEERRYCIGVNASATFDARLAELSSVVRQEQIEKVLRVAGNRRFPDWIFGDDEADAKEISVNWRGSIRRGQIFWQQPENENNFGEGDHNFDWKITLNLTSPPAVQAKNAIPQQLIWQAAPLRAEEQNVLRRFVALQTNAELEAEFGDAAAVALQTHAALVARIWTRAFLDEAAFLLAGEILTFAEESQAAATLGDFLARNLAQIFDRLFPAHPNFAAMLGAGEAAQLASDFFGGGDANAPAAQELARQFLVPLGLVAERGAHLALESDERLLQQPFIKQIWEKLDTAGDNDAAKASIIPLAEIHALGRSEPYGFSSETQHLILAALAAHRRLEFITREGERIGNRALDLQFGWADVAGVARLQATTRNTAELLAWAKRLTGENLENVISVDAPIDAEAVRAALENWLQRWRADAVLKRFEELPDDSLNVRAWRLATNVGRSFGAAVETIEAVLENQVALADGLERVAAAFYDDLTQIDVYAGELAELKIFVGAAAARDDIWRFVALAEATGDQRTEDLRNEIFQILENHASTFDFEVGDKLAQLAQEFKNAYAEIYVARHDAVIHSAQRAQLLEKLLTSIEWSEFVELGELPIFHPRFQSRAAELRRRAEGLKCNLDVRQILLSRPVCGCGFRLTRAFEMENLPHELRQTVAEARRSFRLTLKQLAAPLAASLERCAAAPDEFGAEIAASAARLKDDLRRADAELPALSASDARALLEAVKAMQKIALSVRAPRGINALPREELRAKLNQWLDNLPDAPFLVKLTDGATES